jgi:hypothetical protein
MTLEELARMANHLLRERPELAQAEVYAVWRKGRRRDVFLPLSALGPGLGQLGRPTVDVVIRPEQIITIG